MEMVTIDEEIRALNPVTAMTESFRKVAIQREHRPLAQLLVLAVLPETSMAETLSRISNYSQFTRTAQSLMYQELSQGYTLQKQKEAFNR